MTTPDSAPTPVPYQAPPPPVLGQPPSPSQPPVTAGYPSAVIPVRAQTRQFAFDGGAGTYIGTGLLALLVTVVSLGFAYPFALVLRERWRAKHSYIEGRQLVFNGTGWGLFGLWWKWLLLIIVTIGIYGFWVGPRIQRWKWEHTSWAQQLPGQYGAVRA